MAAKPRRALSVAALSLFALFVTTVLVAAEPAQYGKLKFSRLYTSADGNSHFSDETVDLKPLGTSGIEGTLGAFRVGDVKGAMFLALKAGKVEEYHIAPRRQIMLCVQGIVEVTAGDGTKRRATPGQFILLEDTSGKGHITHSIGPEDHVALAFPLADDVLAKK